MLDTLWSTNTTTHRRDKMTSLSSLYSIIGISFPLPQSLALSISPSLSRIHHYAALENRFRSSDWPPPFIFPATGHSRSELWIGEVAPTRYGIRLLLLLLRAGEKEKFTWKQHYGEKSRDHPPTTPNPCFSRANKNQETNTQDKDLSHFRIDCRSAGKKIDRD